MHRFLIKSFAVTFLVASMLALCLRFSTVYAQTVLFRDSFGDGSASDWDKINSNSWRVNTNNEYGISIPGVVTNSVPSDSIWNPIWQNFTFDVDLRGVSGVDKNILVKYKDSNNFYEIHHNADFGGTIYFEKVVDGSTRRLGSIRYPLANGPTYHFRIEKKDHHFKIYETSVANNLLFDVEDVYPFFIGDKIGFRSGANVEVWFDNVVVTELTDTPPLPSLNVPDIKQYTLPWGSQIYDTANLWSSDPTISRWGCALTSTAMVLRYFGYDVTPETLNNWLKSQVDGYIRNGLLNWLAVSRYTKLNPNSSGNTLEYKRLAGTSQNLIDEITQGRPAILEEPGHYVVAKSQLSTTFGINDPAYSDITTLEPYNNAFASIRTYIPSHTNLSYILLVTDSNTNISVFGPDGNQINGYSYIESPLVDDIDSNQNSGSTFNVFSFPKPPAGDYKVELDGNGSYTFESYLYNQNGDVNRSTFDGLISNGETDRFTITIAGDSGNSQTRQDLTINSLINDLDDMNSQKLIFKSQIYSLLRNLLILSRGMSDRGKAGAVSGLLNSFYSATKAFTPKFIDQGSSNILQAETLELLNNL